MMNGTDLSEEKKPRINLLNDERVRAWAVQALVLLLLLGVAAYVIYNTAYNLRKAGITTGFGFLKETAGFEIGLTLIDYSRQSTYSRAFLVGISNTLLVSVLGIFFATLLGFFLGIIRLSSNWLVSRMAMAYTEIIRNIPLMLQVLFWYLAILSPLPGPREALSFKNVIFLCNRGLQIPKPLWEKGFAAVLIAMIAAAIMAVFLILWSRTRQRQTGKQFPAYLTSLGLMIGVSLLALILTDFPLSWEIPVLKGFNFAGGVAILPELLALWLSLTLYTATFIGEYVRSGIMAVDKGQREAAFALGHSPWMTYRLVIIPQAMRVVTPPLISQYLTLVKNSSLAVVVGYPDLVHVFAGTALNQSGQAVEIICMTMAVYLTISLLISLFMNWYNRKYALRGT